MSHQLSFLDLPSQLRQRIYGYAGITNKAIDLSWSHDEITIPETEDEIGSTLELGCWHDGYYSMVKREEYFTLKQYWEYDEEWETRGMSTSDSCCEKEECFAQDSCFALLLTCKTIFLELWERIYGENRFLLDRGSPREFQRFMKFGSYSIRALTHLTIRLDGEPPERIDTSLHWTRTSDLLPMKHYSRYGKQAYKEWNALIARLRECPIVPGRLSMYLVASVPDVREARLVLQPLESLPSLKSCGIWLNCKSIPELKALIQQTVERLITRKEGEEEEEEEEEEEGKGVPFRYLDLPQEIRLRILGFSDLCASPHVEWKPPTSLLDKIDPVRRPCCDCHDYLGHIDEGIHFEGCKQEYIVVPRGARNGLEMEFDHINDHCCVCPLDYQSDCKLRNDPYMCIFDCSDHSSYTAPKRRAWRQYCHSLFLVNHQVRQDAIPIFFQKRHFVITPIYILPLRHLKRWSIAFHEWESNPLPRTELSLFLSSMPKEALRHIRRLEWLLPAPESYLRLPRAAYFDYLDTIELMVQAMTLTNLTLVINIRATRIRDVTREGCNCDFKWPVRTSSEGAIYNTLLSPLCRLGENGLKNCWIYLRMIWKREYDQGYSRDNDEKMWERKIMGDERYDATREGKPWEERVERTTDIHPRGPGDYATYREHYPYFH
ncbi:hypothetical protein K505DRAFT_12483 [Melanomma pulvis-pyrius CBS 109.77]|uniref:F-box domain-containing protein n=1 Tax=Melanomma pulvis-pyrius CBS 109.77 TaxID=1314802 RepID=A0A6A6XGC1_9PLEO|nr:hypothetical protein K505DRAFT_12483 [Melanomma pulvis-pyrius CBS 109.77]